MRRVLPLCLLLAACEGAGAADMLRVALWPLPVPDSLFVASDDPAPARWDAEDEPRTDGPALLLTLGSRQASAALLQEEGERRLWRTQGGVVVATDGPRIVATAGLSEVLAATRFEGPDGLASALEADGWQGTRVVDLARGGADPARMRFGLRLECRMRARPTEAVEVLLVEETCRGGARFVNRFWADARTGGVFRSEQWIGDALPALRVDYVAARAPVEVVTPAR
ncbi:YjbF family lipoprotein [Roseomonas sp. PWR1]|uniref:YjbF family lipoprotein n=1 Tax=Roseomonas nitratireducens TaxID=2820810 RepID=A0ABS4AVC5_9PROT|nr:YjbF family lipoprotein [Neoroseomonas nitratireducens]MBP0465320.1 YjbF family lipoprotein [Neoroseomonas nitratireducens]